jgi:hypothetical protein
MLSLTLATGNRAKRSATSAATFRWRVKILNPAGIDPSLTVQFQNVVPLSTRPAGCASCLEPDSLIPVQKQF